LPDTEYGIPAICKRCGVADLAVREAISWLKDAVESFYGGPYMFQQNQFDGVDTPNVYAIGCTLDNTLSDP
jgi:hypothetical protein